MKVQRICVFCGSSPGEGPAYLAAADRLGAAMLKRNFSLVYGGARFGLMGRLADSLLKGGAEVVGVMPSSLVDREVAHPGITDLRIVDSMHQRKSLMVDLADAFIAMPGGLGTLEEILEALTWAQLGLHDKPCGFLNVGGFFDALMGFLDHATDQSFIASQHRELVLESDDPDALLDRIAAFDPPRVDKARWIHGINAGPTGGPR